MNARRVRRPCNDDRLRIGEDTIRHDHGASALIAIATARWSALAGPSVLELDELEGQRDALARKRGGQCDLQVGSTPLSFAVSMKL